MKRESFCQVKNFINWRRGFFNGNGDDNDHNESNNNNNNNNNNNGSNVVIILKILFGIKQRK